MNKDIESKKQVWAILTDDDSKIFEIMSNIRDDKDIPDSDRSHANFVLENQREFVNKKIPKPSGRTPKGMKWNDDIGCWDEMCKEEIEEMQKIKMEMKPKKSTKHTANPPAPISGRKQRNASLSAKYTDVDEM